MYSPKSHYKVLIRCFTFNHSQYIFEALTSFAVQQTNFPFVCLIVDDSSTDGTQSVIMDFINKYCDMSKSKNYDENISKIIIVPHSKNQNCTFAVYLLKENLYFQRKRKMDIVWQWRNICDYEAICEGDDHWIDNCKIQNQAFFLDSNPDYVLSHTDFNEKDMKTGKVRSMMHRRQYNLCSRKYVDYRNLYKNLICGFYSCTTLTVMTRLSAVKEVEMSNAFFREKDMKMGDTPMWVGLSGLGKFHYIDSSTAEYRIISESATHSECFENVIEFYQNCFKMIDLLTVNLPEGKHVGQLAKAQYLELILKTVYICKSGYVGEVLKKLGTSNNLFTMNSNLMLKTMNSGNFVKKAILLYVKTINIIQKLYRYYA